MLSLGAYGASQIGEAQQSPEFKESSKFYAKASAKSQQKIKEGHYQPPPSASPEETAKREQLRKALSSEKDVVKLPGGQGKGPVGPVSDPGEKGGPVSDPGETGGPALTPGASADEGPMKLSGKERKELDMIRRQIEDLAAAAIGIIQAERVPRTKGQFGTAAHGIFEEMIKIMNRALEAAGSKRSEVFYDAFGNETSRRASGSKGADVQITYKGMPIENVDLKTGRGGSASGLEETERRSSAPLSQVGPRVPVTFGRNRGHEQVTGDRPRLCSRQA